MVGAACLEQFTVRRRDAGGSSRQEYGQTPGHGRVSVAPAASQSGDEGVMGVRIIGVEHGLHTILGWLAAEWVGVVITKLNQEWRWKVTGGGD
jgi:hypothetical protein